VLPGRCATGVKSLLIFGGVLLTACEQAPACRIDASVADSRQANAGCLIKQNGQLLVVEHHNGRLGFPAGTGDRNESAQCTAHRETWEETGLDVEVGALLRSFDNGFRLYACHTTQVAGEAVSRPWQVWREIRSVHWLDPASITADRWRYPEQWPQVRLLFDTLP